MFNVSQNAAFSPAVELARHRQFMRDVKPHLIGGIVSGCFLYFIFQEFTTQLEAIVWFVCQCLLASSSLALYRLHARYQTRFNAKQWRHIIFTMALLWGLVWSLPGVLFLDISRLEYLAALIIFVCTMTISPAPGMAVYPYAYSVFLTLPLCSLGLQLWYAGLNGWLILGMPFFWAGSLAYGWQLHKTITDSICLRIGLEQARQEAESANQAKSNFLAAASHDLRQPLQAIELLFAALKIKLKLNEHDDLVNKLDSSIDNLSELLNTLLDVSKLDAGVLPVQRQHMQLPSALSKTLLQYELIARQKQLRFDYHLGDDTVFVDPVILDRVVHNLLSNAFRYTEQGSVCLSSRRDAQSLILSVTDTGLGIAKAEQSAIFDEFYQLHNPERDRNKGIGLGLAIVKRLVKLQSWQLSLVSELGQGSCFSIQIPLGELASIKPIQAPRHANTQMLGMFQNNPVLLIDDDEAVRTSLTLLMQSWGCDVRAFGSVAQAIKFFEQSEYDSRAHKAWQPELIISDFRLRDEQTGIDAIRTVQAKFQAQIAATLITGDTAPERIKKAKDSGFSVLHKPIKAAQLRQLLRQYLSV